MKKSRIVAEIVVWGCIIVALACSLEMYGSEAGGQTIQRTRLYIEVNGRAARYAEVIAAFPADSTVLGDPAQSVAGSGIYTRLDTLSEESGGMYLIDRIPAGWYDIWVNTLLDSSFANFWLPHSGHVFAHDHNLPVIRVDSGSVWLGFGKHDTTHVPGVLKLYAGPRADWSIPTSDNHYGPGIRIIGERYPDMSSASGPKNFYSVVLGPAHASMYGGVFYNEAKGATYGLGKNLWVYADSAHKEAFRIGCSGQAGGYSVLGADANDSLWVYGTVGTGDPPSWCGLDSIPASNNSVTVSVPATYRDAITVTPQNCCYGTLYAPRDERDGSSFVVRSSSCEPFKVVFAWILVKRPYDN
ncbi:MAG: hypothetical protein KAW17_09685 [Candidatus Eisenbacteria sp.]|nr:hypothetical protein [Candidatus Eisenbacteria bacterium]